MTSKASTAMKVDFKHHYSNKRNNKKLMSDFQGMA